MFVVCGALCSVLCCLPARDASAQTAALPAEGDYTLRDFRFDSGEILPELRLHYITLGKPARDAGGRVRNAFLILHGTGGTGRNFLSDNFAGVLFGQDQPLDDGRYYIILPDGIGHGRSTKPSDGLHARFPRYEYDIACFVNPPLYAFGNAGRNIPIGPGLFTWDFGPSKDFRLTEKTGLQFRAEFFNLLNRANFGLPSGSIGSAAAGTVTSVVTNARQIQFALRLHW